MNSMGVPLMVESSVLFKLAALAQLADSRGLDKQSSSPKNNFRDVSSGSSSKINNIIREAPVSE